MGSYSTTIYPGVAHYVVPHMLGATPRFVMVVDVNGTFVNNANIAVDNHNVTVSFPVITTTNHTVNVLA